METLLRQLHLLYTTPSLNMSLQFLSLDRLLLQLLNINILVMGILTSLKLRKVLAHLVPMGISCQIPRRKWESKLAKQL